MEVFNIGPFELLVILVIMFVLLGPDEMKRTARRIAISVRKFLHSPLWAEITGMKEEIQELPRRLIEDTGLDEAYQDIKQTTTAVTEETNAAVKESMEAARVPEVEHARVMTAQNISPNAGRTIHPPRKHKPAGTLQPLTSDTEAASPDREGMDAESLADDALAHTLEVDIEPIQREPAQDKSIMETVNTIAPPAEVIEKTRIEHADTAESPAVDVEASPKTRRTTRRKTEIEPQASAPGKNGRAVENPDIDMDKDETNKPNAA